LQNVYGWTGRGLFVVEFVSTKLGGRSCVSFVGCSATMFLVAGSSLIIRRSNSIAAAGVAAFRSCATETTIGVKTTLMKD
jgi:hypothetical protein